MGSAGGKRHETIMKGTNFNDTTFLRIAVCLISSMPGVVKATADWPHAGGPTYNGHADSTNISWPWPENKPALLWKRDIGEGYSGISAVNGRLYTQVQSRDGQYIIC